MTEYTFTVTYSEKLLKQAVQTFMWRRIGRDWKLWLAFALMAIATVVLLWLGDRSWLVGLLGASLLMLLVFLAAIWRAHLVNTLGKFRSMGEPQAVITVSDTGLIAASGMGSSTIPWSTIEQVWEFPEYWMIFLSPSQFFTIPTEEIPKEALRFARSKLQVSKT